MIHGVASSASPTASASNPRNATSAAKRRPKLAHGFGGSTASDAQLCQGRVFGTRRGGACSSDRAARDLRKGDDPAQVGLTREQRHEYARCPIAKPAVRRRAHLQRVEEPAELRIRFSSDDAQTPNRPLPGGLPGVDPQRAPPELPAVPTGRSAELNARAGSASISSSWPSSGPVKGWWIRTSSGPCPSSELEQREIDDPAPRRRPRSSTRSSSSRQCSRSAPSTAHDGRPARPRRRARSTPAARGTHRAQALRGTSRSASAPRPPPRTRVGEPLRTPLLRHLLQLRRARRGSSSCGTTRKRTTAAFGEDGELGAARDLASRPGSRARSEGRACRSP